MGEHNEEKKVHTFKVVPMGDGSVYGYKEIDENGSTVRVSEQSWPTEADAEKAIRAIRGEAEIEVTDIKNINAEANQGVNIVRPEEEARDRNHGMTEVHESVEEKAKPEGAPSEAEVKEAAEAQKTPEAMAEANEAREAAGV